MAASGILLLDKPSGPTSHDVVAAARRVLGTRKIGHAGTLDPMASGLMLLGVGSSTRLLTYLVGLDKQYDATIRLGVSTATDDAEGEVIARRDASVVPDAAVAAAVAALTGEIRQVPSTFSAIHVEGRRAYERARAGEAVELAPRAVRVDRFEVRATRRQQAVIDLDVAVTVSSGTYVRALARDLGASLGVGGHLTALRRTSIGPFSVAEAVGPDADLAAAVRDPAEVARALFPAVDLDAGEVLALTQGKRIPVDVPDAPIVAALAPGGRLVGLVDVRNGMTRVLINLPATEVLA